MVDLTNAADTPASHADVGCELTCHRIVALESVHPQNRKCVASQKGVPHFDTRLSRTPKRVSGQAKYLPIRSA